ncbi:hypothetical protein BRC79_05695, partial [Halobacteriales archaeon QH_8_67_27]
MTGTNDKLRSLFLTMLMVVSVFGGTVAFAGTAAAANTDPGVDSAIEAEDTDEGDIRIEFNRSVRQNTSSLGALTAANFTVYVRQAGNSSFDVYNNSNGQLTGEVTHDPNNDDLVVLEGENTWDDLSPA